MVTVVVDDGDAVLLALLLETAVDTREGFQTGANDIRRDAQLHGDGDGRGCIQDVMFTGHPHLELSELPGTRANLELAVIEPADDSSGLEIGLSASPIGDGTALDLRQYRLHILVFDA